MSILDLSAVELGRKIQNRELSVREATEAVLSRIDVCDNELNCYITVDMEGALKRSEEVQKKIDTGELTGPLAGVPAAIKDNLCTRRLLTTCGSKMLSNFVPAYTATAVANLERTGAIIIGKTNMDEFAMGNTNETSAFGAVKNPWNRAYVSGGSSGGSCAAVAADECFYALGSDTGGSIRQPSAYCGVVGLKPTYGTVSRYGLIAYASSLEQIGPVAKDVTDCAAILEAVSSYDSKDSTSIMRDGYDFVSALTEDAGGLRVGIPKDYFTDGPEADIRSAVLNAAEVLKGNGAVVEEFNLGMVEYAVPAYYIIASAEAGSNLARFDGVKYAYRYENAKELDDMYKKTRSEGFGEEVKRRIMLGTFVLSSGCYDAYYLKALRTKALIKQAFDKAFDKYDVILCPVTPGGAIRLGCSISDPVERYLTDVYTVAVNLAGLPAMSVPCGIDSKGLPIGVQLIGNCFREKDIIRAGYSIEKSVSIGKCRLEKTDEAVRECKSLR